MSPECLTPWHDNPLKGHIQRLQVMKLAGQEDSELEEQIRRKLQKAAQKIHPANLDDSFIEAATISGWHLEPMPKQQEYRERQRTSHASSGYHQQELIHTLCLLSEHDSASLSEIRSQILQSPQAMAHALMASRPKPWRDDVKMIRAMQESEHFPDAMRMICSQSDRDELPNLRMTLEVVGTEPDQVLDYMLNTSERRQNNKGATYLIPAMLPTAWLNKYHSPVRESPHLTGFPGARYLKPGSSENIPPLPAALEKAMHEKWSPALHRMRIHPCKAVARLRLSGKGDIAALIQWANEPQHVKERCARLSLISVAQGMEPYMAIMMSQTISQSLPPENSYAPYMWIDNSIDTALKSHDSNFYTEDDESTAMNRWRIEMSNSHRNTIEANLDSTRGIYSNQKEDHANEWRRYEQLLEKLPQPEKEIMARIMLECSYRMGEMQIMRTVGMRLESLARSDQADKDQRLQHLQDDIAVSMALRARVARHVPAHINLGGEVHTMAMQRAASLPGGKRGIWFHPDYLSCWKEAIRAQMLWQ